MESKKEKETCVVKFEAYLSEVNQKVILTTEGTCSKEIMAFLNSLGAIHEKPKSKGFFF